MFIVMNCFQIIKGCEVDFEKVWKECDIYLKEVLGFMNFYFLCGLEEEMYILYLFYLVWVFWGVFEDWMKFEVFCKVYVNVGDIQGIYLGYF